MTKEELIDTITDKLKVDTTALRIVLLSAVIASLQGMSQEQLDDIAETLKINN